MINTESPDETPEKATRRSALKRELDAFSQLVTTLRPFTVEQRKKIMASAEQFLGTDEA